MCCGMWVCVQFSKQVRSSKFFESGLFFENQPGSIFQTSQIFKTACIELHWGVIDAPSNELTCGFILGLNPFPLLPQMAWMATLRMEGLFKG